MRSGILTTLALLLAAPVAAADGDGRSSYGTPRVPATDLAVIAQEAPIIVRGTVLEVVEEPHPELANLQTLRVTLAVLESFASTVPERFEFRQLVFDERLSYRVGGDYFLFLRRPSRVGLTSPVAFDQGRIPLRAKVQAEEIRDIVLEARRSPRVRVSR